MSSESENRGGTAGLAVAIFFGLATIAVGIGLAGWCIGPAIERGLLDHEYTVRLVGSSDVGGEVPEVRLSGQIQGIPQILTVQGRVEGIPEEINLENVPIAEVSYLRDYIVITSKDEVYRLHAEPSPATYVTPSRYTPWDLNWQWKLEKLEGARY